MTLRRDHHDTDHTADSDGAIEVRSPVPANVPKRHLYPIPEAMALLSMSRSVLYEQIRAGRIKTVTQGRRRLVPAVSVTEYVKLLLTESGIAYG